MKLASLLVAALLVTSPLPAMAQVSPFWSTRYGPRLSSADLDLLLSSVNRLNRMPGVAVGSMSSWRDPATGTHGTSVVERIFHHQGMTCHGLRHQVYLRGQATPRRYDLTWCRTAEDEWKLLK
jgi:hypothetical protein